MIFLASKSSLTVSAYQLTLPSNLLRNFSLSLLSSFVWVSSRFRRTEKKAFLSVSYFCLLIFLPVLPNGCLVSIFSSAIFVSPVFSLRLVPTSITAIRTIFTKTLANVAAPDEVGRLRGSAQASSTATPGKAGGWGGRSGYDEAGMPG